MSTKAGDKDSANNSNGSDDASDKDSAGSSVSKAEYDKVLSTVSKAEYDKVLSTVSKIQKDFEALKSERDALSSKLSDLDKKSKESAGDFKGLYEQQKSAFDELLTKYDGLKKSMTITEKHKAASAALVKAGIHADALKLLDKETFDEMQIEATSQGRFIVHGTELFVDKFKKEYAFAFGSQKPPTMNNGGGSGGGAADETKLTAAYMYEIEKKDPAKYKELWPKYVEQKRKEREARA